MDTVINREGQTLWDILRHISYSRSMFKGYALHFNYNIIGQITEINPINFEFVRWSKDLKRLIVNPDWWRRNRRNEEITYCPFNPSTVQGEIQQAGSIEKYTGQLMYWIPNLKDWYTVCNWDSVLDDAQFEAEAKLYSLSSIQNDYSLSGIVAYPKNITDQKEIDEIKEDVRKDTGSNNAGGIRVVGAMPSENLTNWKWFTPMSRNNIDNLHTNQVDRAKMNIYAAFRQPPILNGVATQGMFNQESFMDAFDYYNSQTETERKETEKELTKILACSIWPVAVVIQPKKFIGRNAVTAAPTTPAVPATTQATEINDTLTNLSGRQLQGVFRITRKYANGDLTYDQAALMLKTGFGFDDDSIKIWLINDNENG
jgi:hypothetical protein